MNYKQKLTSLLCEVEEVKRDIEELRFGTLMKTKTGVIRKFIGFELLRLDTFNLNKFYGLDIIKGNLKLVNKSQYKIIGNPLDYPHLMMYCGSKNIYIGIYGDGSNTLSDDFKLDYTRSFDNQDDKVYEQIFNYLNKLKG